MRLIDADKAQEDFNNAFNGEVGIAISKVSADILNRQETIDAVPVVRCKDCKNKRLEHGYLWCLFCDAERNLDDFCSYGEKKER